MGMHVVIIRRRRWRWCGGEAFDEGERGGEAVVVKRRDLMA